MEWVYMTLGCILFAVLVVALGSAIFDEDHIASYTDINNERFREIRERGYKNRRWNRRRALMIADTERTLR